MVFTGMFSVETVLKIIGFGVKVGNIFIKFKKVENSVKTKN